MIDDEKFARVSLFKELRDLAKSGATLDASIVTTFAFNGLFFEEVLLRSFERAGSRLNIVLVDASQLSESMQDPLRRPRRAGSDYLLVPIHGLSAFHPKIVALLSEKRSVLAIGSHNATDAGFGYNNELTAFWGLGKTSPHLVRGAVDYVVSWLETADALPPGLLREVRDRLLSLAGFEAIPANAEAEFIGSNADRSLWDQLKLKVPGEVRRVWVVGPYFDVGANFIRELDKQLRPAEIIVAVQPETALIPVPTQFPASTRFVDISAAQAFSGFEFSESFLHGKALVVEGSEGLIVSIGSANPTGAGWLKQERWNAEANIVCVGSLAAEAFEGLGISQLSSAASLTTEQLGAIAVRTAEVRKRDDDQSSQPSPPTIIGEVVQNGIRLSGASLDKGEAVLRSGESHDLAVTLSAVPEGVLIGLNGGQASSGVHALVADGATLAFVVLNDPHSIRNAARSRESTRILDRLGALGTSVELDDLFDLLGRHVLTPDAEAVAGRSQTAAGSGSNDTSDENRPRGPRGVSLPIAGEEGVVRRRVCDGLIADIVAALIKSLSMAGGALPGPLDGDAPDLDEGDSVEGAASERFASNLEALDVQPQEVDWPRLVTACRKQVGLLVRRLSDRINAQATENPSADWLLGRLVIVVSLLQQLRSRPPQTNIALGGRARPASLVSVDHLKAVFHLAVRALYGSGSSLAERLEADPSTRESEERWLLDCLLVWMAREIGADLRQVNPRGATPVDVQVLADLAPVAMSGVGSTEFPRWLVHRDPWLALWDDAAQVDDDWLNRTAAFGRRLHGKGALAAMTSAIPPRVGSLVLWTGEPEFPWAVSAINGKRVSVVGIGGETKQVLGSFVTTLDLALLSAAEIAA
jgi:hypothetical protein